MSDDYGFFGGSPETNPNLTPIGGGGSDWLSASSLKSAGPLALGAAGLGAILAKGKDPLPWEYGELTGGIPGLRAEAGALSAEGHELIGQGRDALGMAQRGELTPGQSAQLHGYESSLTNQARQQYFNMGRNPDQDTSFIQTTADIDAKVNAMAQEQIRTTIQLGLGEMTGGSSLTSQALGFSNAANQALITAGEAQLKQDENYSKALTGSFAAIGQMFGAAAGFAVGGPPGAMAGSALGGAAGKMFG